MTHFVVSLILCVCVGGGRELILKPVSDTVLFHLYIEECFLFGLALGWHWRLQ